MKREKGSQGGGAPVRAWEEAVTLPTYEVPPPDPNPMFLERRVYQGSSGRVYPLPVTDRVSHSPVAKSWRAVHIDNGHVYVMVLPDIGGRVHIARDQSNGYDFIYNQKVIKPALVGLLGPWISGGIEINWPQHHRPTTYMPTECSIEESDDGSKTIWLSEHEPMNRLKGMHGVCLRPGRAALELRGQIYNRTPLPQTFLWWANVATAVHEQYQSFFPPDVAHVADHARRAMSTFPRCSGSYYGVDYGGRARWRDNPFGALGRADDLTWYANIPVPTSYMAMGSKCDFLGGYDHKAQAGIVQIADRRIAPGKKQWTWGNHAFGHAWDRELTDDGVPYIELMAGVYTDNQPDFSWLMPFESRMFSQFWYPIQRIGPAKNANLDAAVNLEEGRLGVAVTRRFEAARVVLERNGRVILERRADLAPASPFVEGIELPTGELRARVLDRDGNEIVSCVRAAPSKRAAPAPATAAPPPSQVRSGDELYLTGVHLDQYRHATRDPQHYWRECLSRDPCDWRANNAMGLSHMRRGEHALAEPYFHDAIASLTRRNPNPYDGEAYYNLGLCLRWLSRDDEAYDALYKATWNYTWRSAAFHAIACLDSRAGRYDGALVHLRLSLDMNRTHNKARLVMSAILRRVGRDADADAVDREAIDVDPFASIERFPVTNVQAHLDFAFDLAEAGLFDEAMVLLHRVDSEHPMLAYTRAWLCEQQGDTSGQRRWLKQGRASPTDYCFPSRLEELRVLESALKAAPDDHRAAYYLGNLLYDKRRYAEAIRSWEKSRRGCRTFSIVHRNLGIAYFNIRADAGKAARSYAAARRAAPGDARLLYEQDQLRKRLGNDPTSRLKILRAHLDLVERRDDLSIELATLNNLAGSPEQAAALLASRRFHPWEGGEGSVLAQHEWSQVLMGYAALDAGDAPRARDHFAAAIRVPENLGESRHLLAARSHLDYSLGLAMHEAGDTRGAAESWKRAANAGTDFQGMAVRTYSEMTYWKGMSQARLGRRAEATRTFKALLSSAQKQLKTPATIDYFATSLPNMLLFIDDLNRRNRIDALYLRGLALAGLGKTSDARSHFAKVLAMDPGHLGATFARSRLSPARRSRST